MIRAYAAEEIDYSHHGIIWPEGDLFYRAAKMALSHLPILETKGTKTISLKRINTDRAYVYSSISSEKESFVLRVLNPDAHYNHKQVEMKIETIAGVKGISSKVIYASIEDHI